MSSSLLYHAFTLPSYQYVSQKYECGKIISHIRPKGELYCCPICKSWRIIRREVCIRRLRSIPISLKSVWIEVEISRIIVFRLRLCSTNNIGFARQRKSYTCAFERYVIELGDVFISPVQKNIDYVYNKNGTITAFLVCVTLATSMQLSDIIENFKSAWIFPIRKRCSIINGDSFLSARNNSSFPYVKWNRDWENIFLVEY